MTRSEIIALVAALAAVLIGWRALRWGIDKGDPRRATIRRIRAEANPLRDLIVITDEAPELVAAAAPVQALYGVPSLRDLTPLRRLYAVAPSDPPLGPFDARLGVATAVLGVGARRWDLDGLATVVFDLTDELLEHTVARRTGGRFDGPCVRSGALMRCNSHDDWNHLRAEPHNMAGVPIRCVWAHPQENSALVIEVPNAPPARYLVGAVGFDDYAVQSAHGAPVTNHVRFVPRPAGPTLDVDIVAQNRAGTTPYRLNLGGRAGSLSFSITTRDAGARQFCFTAVLTR